MTLYLTTAARDQLADVAGSRLGALTLTRLQAGSGSGPGGAMDAGRAALRTPQDAAEVVELDAPDGTLAVAAEITGTADYDVTEAGLFGRVDAGAEILVGYWSDGGTVLAGVADGGTLELAATLGIQDVTGPTVTLSQDVPGPPGLPGDCAQTEADLATCVVDLATRTADLATCEADLATRTADLATCEADLATCEVESAAKSSALAGSHHVTVAGDTVFTWPWSAATRAQVIVQGGAGGQGGACGDIPNNYVGYDFYRANFGARGSVSWVEAAGNRHSAAGGVGGAGGREGQSGGAGGRGGLRALVISGLSVGDEIEICVGAGGPGGSGSFSASNGSSGASGQVLIIPKE